MSFGVMSSSRSDPTVKGLCEEFRSEWGGERRPRIETYLDRGPASAREELLERLLTLEFDLRLAAGETPCPAEYLQRFPGQSKRLLSVHRKVAAGFEPTVAAGQTTAVSPPAEQAPAPAIPTGDPVDSSQVLDQLPRDEPDEGGTSAATAMFAGDARVAARGASNRPPEGFGRYQPVRLLGKGSSGRVYLARDTELDRDVAVKVLSAGLVGSRSQCEALLIEARIAAGLRHPGIVAVHDIGYDGRGEVFIVLDYVPGATLADEFATARPSPTRLAGTVLRIAEAMDHAHSAGLVHRDLKPLNILMDLRGTPYVTDFGLAVSAEMQRLKSGEIAGTPSYMAPEQVRGEAHRLDGRTDIWALGVILYEGMTGRLPFNAGLRDDLFREIQRRDPKPARRIDETLPRELERIALKCLAKRMTDRYQTAAELAGDLQAWIATEGMEGLAREFSQGEDDPHPLGGDRVRIVPKGLRAFDGEDADFFLALLPGPKDRHGLPESIRFWKARIEERDRAEVFPVGLIYGPSGCGKSSMVKAGLLPRLADDVRPIYVEATPGTTESRLLAILRREVPGLPPAAGLAETAAAIREGRHEPGPGKLLIVIDQFEQWLQAHAEVAETELVQALRQADGHRLQVLILVRDDFWMAIVRFMRALEVPLVEGHNSAAVELFDVAHARTVLAEIGRARGNLPADPTAPGLAAVRFLDRAVEGLAGRDRRIVPVRLILFAEMVRHRPWNPSTIHRLGGIEGIGVTFLEETFAEGSSPPTHRLHRLAAQRVLKALLPDPHSDLKGSLRTALELQGAAGYLDRPADFAELLEILDGELRMVTPSDPEALGGEGCGTKAEPGAVCYQLTHDYLVPPLRQWLDRTRQGTRQGRAEARLETITAVWRARPGARQLPSLLEWVGILRHVNSRSWSFDARRMMQAATWHHVRRFGGLLTLLAILAAGVWYGNERWAAHSLLAQALKADYGELSGLFPEILQRRAWVRPPLERIEAHPIEADRRDRQVAGVLLFLDQPTPRRAAFLHERLLVADADELGAMLQVLRAHPARAGAAALQAHLDSDEADSGSRLRAACGLAAIAPGRIGWEAAAPVLVRALLAEDQRALGRWLQFLRPAGPALIPELERVCRDRELDEPSRVIAAEALAGILGQQGDTLRLAEATVRVTPEATRVLVRRLARTDGLDRVGTFLASVVARERGAPASGWDGAEGVIRRANAAFTLLALDCPAPVWPILRHHPDPTLRSELIRRMADPPVNRRLLLDRVRQPELDPQERQALLLALAEADLERISPHDRAEYAAVAGSLHREAPEAGVHSAAELLLRRLGRPDARASRAGDREPVPRGSDGTGWYCGPNGHTLAVLPTPLRFWMGSPPGDEGRVGWYESSERRHVRQVDRRLAVATTEVTRAQFEAFAPDHPQDLEHSTGDGADPANKINWYDAARYCNWLSERAGIPRDQWVYPEPVGPGMTLPASAVEKTGYRLPTEAEWEGFCRAGTETTRPFGRIADLLPRYGWVWLNAQERSHPVGRLLPNQFGLFDVLGNVWEWCHDGPVLDDLDGFPPYPAGIADRPAGDLIRTTLIADESLRMMRGGGYDWAPSMARSARRHHRNVKLIYPHTGFRVVRTLTAPERPVD